MRQIEVFAKVNSKWEPYPLDFTAGPPQAMDMWRGMEGQEVVVKIINGDRVTYAAGTQALRDHYEGQGLRAITFTQMAEYLESIKIGYADQRMLDALATAAGVFPGISLEQIKLPERS